MGNDTLIEIIDHRNQIALKQYGSDYIDGTKAKVFIEDTLIMARNCNYYKGMFDSHANYALHHIMKNEKDEASKHLYKLEHLLSSNKLSEIEKLTYYRVQMIYLFELEHDIENALLILKKAIEISEKIGDRKIIVRLKANLGVIYQDLGNYELALKMFLEAKEFSESILAYDNLIIDYYNLAEVYEALQEYENAEIFYSKSLNLAKENDNKAVINNASAGLARIFSEKNRLVEATEILDLVISSWNDDIFTQYNLIVVNSYALILIKEYRYHEAYDFLLKFEESVDSIEYHDAVLDYYEKFALASEKLNNYKSAYESLKKQNQLIKTISEEKIKKTTHDMMRQEYNKMLSKLETMAIVGKDLTMLLKIEDVIKEVKSKLSSTLSIDSIGVGLVKNGYISYDYFYENDIKVEAPLININAEGSLAAWCIRNKESLYVNDLYNDYRIYTEKPIEKVTTENTGEVRSVIYAPLIVKDKIIGIFTIQTYKPYAYSHEDMEIFSIVSSYVAIALKNIEQSEELEKLSITDMLTGILNRRGFTNAFDKLLENQYQSLAMLIFDIDFFKSINDKYGHDAGDYTLIKLVEIISNILDNDSVFGRIGGEEFAILVFDHTITEVANISELIRRSIEAYSFNYNENSFGITLSIGFVHTCHPDSNKFDRYYSDADKALYQAKETGRNKVVKFEYL